MSSQRAMKLYEKALAFRVAGDIVEQELAKSTQLARCPIGDPIYFLYHQAVELALKACLLTINLRPGTAKRLVAQMNGAAKLCGGQPLQMARLWFVRAGGKPQPVKDVSASMASPIAIMTAIGAPTTAAPASPDRRALTAMTAARDCDQVASALQHFSQPTNWYDLWTAYEIIEEELWRNTPKIQRPKGKEKLKPRRVLLISRKWVSTDDLQKFAASCNYHRHGAKKPPTPEQNANTYEARQILARILQNWIDEKVL
jgi:hypothetical protein